MENCIFCKIVKGEIPARKVYETEKVLAFLTIEPIAKGHLLVIPKKHFENIFDTEEDYLKDIISVTKKLANKLKKNMNATGVNILHASGKDAQQSVFHFHLHLVPRYKNDKMDAWPKSNYKELNFDEVAEKIKK
jgi:histidine triad (HIT) family protein